MRSQNKSPGSDVSPLTGMRSSNKLPSSDFEALSFDRASLFKKMCEMKERHFYFVADSFYKDFPDPNLMRNKEAIKSRIVCQKKHHLMIFLSDLHKT
jgi:hypothetical protein